MAYTLVLFCIILSTIQILKLANEIGFREFEFEKLGVRLIGPRFGTVIETLLFFSQLSVFIAGILFSGFLKSRFYSFYILLEHRFDWLLLCQISLYFYCYDFIDAFGINQHNKSICYCFLILQRINAFDWYFYQHSFFLFMVLNMLLKILQ